MGAWSFANSFIEEVAEEAGCKNPRPRYAGRSSAASPATGSKAAHTLEQQELVGRPFGDEVLDRVRKRLAAAV